MKFLAIVVLLSIPLFAQLPDAPSHTKVADRNFWLLTAANGAATVGDILTTSLYVGHDYKPCSIEAWSPALYGRQPNPARTSLVMGGLFAASSFGSYELKKHNVRIWKFKLWTVPQSFMTYQHMHGTINNLTHCR